MISFDEFLQQFTDIQHAIMRDHSPEGARNPAICQIMHRDLQLSETPRDNADELAERVAQQTGEDVDPNELDLTVEHGKLHQLLSGMLIQGVSVGGRPETLLALMFVIGRRYGMREAADMFGSLNEGSAA